MRRGGKVASRWVMRVSTWALSMVRQLRALSGSLTLSSPVGRLLAFPNALVAPFHSCFRSIP